MSVRFKFRSSVNFDQVDIDGKPSISVAHLKSKIVSKTHLPLCRDFDLIFSDAVSGQEFRDDHFQIPSGSSVIVKRVPVEAPQSDVAPIASRRNAGIIGAEMVRSSPPVNVEVVNFDDFGADLCLVPESNECGSDLIVDVPRSPKPVRCQKVEASDLSEAGPRDIGQEEEPAQTIPKLTVKENTKIGRVEAENPQAMQNADFPSELKCSLCGTYFKDAVMIPCCQHSFCEKCIHLALVDKRRCPKCLSTKCRVQDLLPNVSLRQAIQRFIQSQILVKSSDDALDHYAPDGESGIQGKEVSYGVAVHKREAELPHSPSSTGKGSNHITAELVAGKSACLGRRGSGCAVGFKRAHGEMAKDFQEENQHFQEAESTSRKKKVLWVDTTGVEKGSLESARQKKGDRSCYMCGSPDHFIRDCPAASSARPMLQSVNTGNAMYPGAFPSCVSPYWNGPPFYQMGPFVNPYGNPGMPPLMPTTAYPVPGYMPSMYSGMPAYRGFTRMGGVADPVGANAVGNLVGSGGGNFQGCTNREKLQNWDLHRGQFLRHDDQGDFIKRHQSNEEERLRSLKSHRDGAESVSNSDDSFTLRSHGRHRQNKRYDDYPERSTSEVEDMPSSSRHCSDEIYERHHKSSKTDGKMRQRGSDSSSRSHHLHNEKKGDKRKRVVSDVRREEFKHHSQSESGLEPSFSSEHKKRKKTKDSSHGSRHSRRSSRSLNSECSRERWQMVSRSDEGSEENYHHPKRKRDTKTINRK